MFKIWSVSDCTALFLLSNPQWEYFCNMFKLECPVIPYTTTAPIPSSLCSKLEKLCLRLWYVKLWMPNSLNKLLKCLHEHIFRGGGIRYNGNRGIYRWQSTHTFLKTPPEQQVVYHFTIGKRIDDPRISILPAYDRIYDNEADMKRSYWLSGKGFSTG